MNSSTAMNTIGLTSDSMSGAFSSDVVGVENIARNTSHLYIMIIALCNLICNVYNEC